MMKELDEAVEALTNLRVQALKFNQEGLEKSLFDIEQMIFKAQDSLQSKGKTKEEVEQLIYDHLTNLPWDGGYPANWQETLAEHLANSMQSNANKDGRVSVDEVSKLADTFMEKSKFYQSLADKQVTAARGLKQSGEARGWKYACYMLRDALGLDRSTNKPLPPKPQT